MPHTDPEPVIDLRVAASALEVTNYAGDMAMQLSDLCEGSGLHGLATLFLAAHGEAQRAGKRLQSSVRKAAAEDAA